MNQVDEIVALAEEIPQLIKQNSPPDGHCRFDPVKTKIAWELVKYESEKSIRAQSLPSN